MNARIIISASFLGLGSLLAVLPTKKIDYAKPSPTVVMASLENPIFYLNADDLASRLINSDPSVFLIDVRDTSVYQEGTIPGAVNVPMAELLKEEYSGYFYQEGKEVILFGNSTEEAREAWQLTRKAGVKQQYMLEEGISGWRKYIIAPEVPPVTAPEEAFILYRKRLGASQFFTGEKLEISTPEAAPMPIPQRKKKMVQGGCS